MKGGRAAVWYQWLHKHKQEQLKKLVWEAPVSGDDVLLLMQ